VSGLTATWADHSRIGKKQKTTPVKVHLKKDKQFMHDSLMLLTVASQPRLINAFTGEVPYE
jgi:hypothetical protein